MSTYNSSAAQTQRHSPSQESKQPNSLQPKASFSSLPIELRDKIWRLTFEPRTISIHLYEGKTPISPRHPSAAVPYIHDQALKTACVIFTATIGVQSPLAVYQVWKERRRNRPAPSPYNGNPTIWEHMRAAPPPGPVALQVCRDSRKVALKDYTPSFGGVNFIPDDDEFAKEWIQEGYSEKKIWVNFKRDLVFVSRASDRIGDLGVPVNWPYGLELFVDNAREEVKRIERLGISGTWEKDGEAVRLRHGVRSGIQIAMELTLKRFEAIKELVVYHSDEIWPAYIASPRTSVRRESEQVRLEITEFLMMEKEKCAEWTAELPVVTISRDLEPKMPMLEFD